MTTTEQNVNENAPVQEAPEVEVATSTPGDIDVGKLTDAERALLATRQEPDEEQISMDWQPPAYINAVAQATVRIAHTIFPDATPEQLEAVKTQVAAPYAHILNDVAYYINAATHAGLENIRKEHVLTPPVRYTLDFSLTAVHAILNGHIPGPYEHQWLTTNGHDIAEWTNTIPNADDLPQEGLLVEFITGNILHTGKLCFFGYLNELGDVHVVSDIVTFWSNELGAWVHTHRVPYFKIIKTSDDVAEPSTEQTEVQTDGESEKE